MAVSDKPEDWKDAWAFHDGKITELQNSKSYLEEELAATKRALLFKEDKVEELLSSVAHLEGKLRLSTKRSGLREDLLEAIERSVRHAFDDESHDLELGWNTAFACLGEAIAHKSTIERTVTIFNRTILRYEVELKDEKTLRSEAAAQISGLQDTVDAQAFELNKVKRERDEAVARSQRQAARITDLESVGEQVLKMQDIILEARDVLNRYKP